MRKETTTEFLKHTYTPGELAAKANILAQACQALTSAEEEKKAATAQYAERIQTEKATIGKTSREMNQCWETRPVVCNLRYNVPNTGIVSIINPETEEVIKTRSMTQDELQETLFQDPQMSIDPEKAIEENIRNFFGIKAVPDDAKSESESDPVAWINGEWIVVASSAEAAVEWLKEKGHQVEGGEWILANPDTCIIEGLESFFGTPQIPVRRAILHMQKEGVSFPMLLKVPQDYMRKLKEGKDPTEAPAAEPQGDAGAAAAPEATPEGHAPEGERKKRGGGRPKGAKNKPKDQPSDLRSGDGPETSLEPEAQEDDADQDDEPDSLDPEAE